MPNVTEGYRTAEVTLGGIDTNELSSQTMDAKAVPGLYFIGEVVDVTGHLGGLICSGLGPQVLLLGSTFDKILKTHWVRPHCKLLRRCQKKPAEVASMRLSDNSSGEDFVVRRVSGGECYPEL